MANELIPQSFSINYTVQVAKEGEKPFQISDSVTLPLGNEVELNRVLAAKPHLAECAPKIIKSLIDSYDPSAKAAKKLLSDLGVSKDPQ